MVIGEPIDLSHLHPSAHRVALLPAAERVRHVRADRGSGSHRRENNGYGVAPGQGWR